MDQVEFPQRPYFDTALPKHVGSQVILCTNDKNLHGRLRQVSGSTAVIDSCGREIRVCLSSINAVSLSRQLPLRDGR
ncbi:hypothetical protein [Paenibacillus mucilaginosus]|uniref:Uncharacterized protein n=1 Tax=Paenibacillus mucilaginosus (strain KNP414) TaxID=1036673 RepID=F8F9W0_PAEMK|nr:hypothetical protein [Paenibacillus mucilaginosus]AEI45158.1 hypothetical protein KNP414_06638 [Paenibacillus mucilaginosus KNP414]MCG7212948.1 hypothetical protein [Paenibacillus mucilaginosus]WDM26639.1 hypothetical protein KCX80_30130 [Paenibacillus mucilaginosus]